MRDPSPQVIKSMCKSLPRPERAKFDTNAAVFAG